MTRNTSAFAAVAAAVSVVIIRIVAGLCSCLRPPPRPHPLSLIASSRHILTAIRAAAASVAGVCNRECVGGLAGVVLMCIGSFSNSFVEAEAAVALHAHVAAGNRCRSPCRQHLAARVARFFCNFIRHTVTRLQSFASHPPQPAVSSSQLPLPLTARYAY